jgi:hypothetical protein
MIDAEDVQRMYVQITLGTAKRDSPFPLTDEMSRAWDQIAREVAQAPPNSIFDVPEIEVPDVPNAPPGSTSPESQATMSKTARLWREAT